MATALRIRNEDIAEMLEQVADLLHAQEANPFRVRAYREAARTVRAQPRPLADLVATEGEAALEKLPGIGASLARAIGEIVRTGRLRLLDRLLGEAGPEALFTVVPGIGPELARRIHDELGIETLEDLEIAAHDGRLEGVEGFGARRVRAVRDQLAVLLGHAARRRAQRARAAEAASRRGEGSSGGPGGARGAGDARGAAPAPAGDASGPGTNAPTPLEPPVDVILDVDREYRERAARGELPRIAPRRFNPAREAWLPILHTDRGPWHFTALFSNTAQAHRLGRTRDWVVVYWEREGHEGQCTVVTGSRGPWRGQRMVRGREPTAPSA